MPPMSDSYYDAEGAEMVTYLSDERVAKGYAWKPHMGGVLLSFGSETLFLQHGYAANAFLDELEFTDEFRTDEHVIMEYFYY